MSLVVIHPGTHATVQDLGRFGYRQWGVPVGGAFDDWSHALANALVGNPETAATLELTLLGGSYHAESPLALALAGAAMDARIERRDGGRIDLNLPQSFTLREGDRLRLGGARRGARTYLATRGGWQTPRVLESRSSETPLQVGDRLAASHGTIPSRRIAFEISPRKTRRSQSERQNEDEDMDSLPEVTRELGGSGEEPFRIVDGPDACDPALWNDRVFRVGVRCDRMGLHLEGPALEVASPPDRVSAPVAPGALQVAGGTLLVLGVACGTMGGYPHVAHVITADLSRLGQLRPGDAVRFQKINVEEARRIDRDERRRREAFLLLVRTAARDVLPT